jgi:hypothetical protein
MIIAVRLWALPACEKKEAPPISDSAGTSARAPTPAAPTAVAEAAPVVDIETLPVEEDFEAEAEKELTLANLSTQLDALDKEISAP